VAARRIQASVSAEESTPTNRHGFASHSRTRSSTSRESNPPRFARAIGASASPEIARTRASPSDDSRIASPTGGGAPPRTVMLLEASVGDNHSICIIFRRFIISIHSVLLIHSLHSGKTYYLTLVGYYVFVLILAPRSDPVSRID
jgi:hypothetical protein